MEIPQRRVFFSQDEFIRAWNGGLEASPKRWNPFGYLATRRKNRERARPELLTEAAHFLAGALLRYDFHLFQNGGLPLLARHSGELVEEIVLRPAPAETRRGLPYLPIAVQLHLSHARLPSVRRRYWRGGSRAPQVVATGDLGQLELPPCWVIWNLGTGRHCLASMVEWTEHLAVPWFEGFHRPIELHGRLQDGCVPLVRTDTALELMLAHYGPVEASVFLERSLRDSAGLATAVKDEMRRLRSSRFSTGFEDDIAHNLAVVAASFSLLSGSDV